MQEQTPGRRRSAGKEWLTGCELHPVKWSPAIHCLSYIATLSMFCRLGILAGDVDCQRLPIGGDNKVERLQDVAIVISLPRTCISTFSLSRQSDKCHPR